MGKEISNAEFDAILQKLVVENPSVLLSIPGVYEILAEHFNNDILDIWKEREGWEKRFIFLTDCVSIQPEEVEELDKMIEDGVEISYTTFIKHVSIHEIHDIFPQYDYYGKGLHIKDDFAVGFYKSKFYGKTCYYLTHSAIEYIFVERN